jgi:cytochrome d ubiquinol oxidase subunit I
MTALELARWQFGITTLYHFIFVPLTIGLAFFTAWAQTKWYRTEDEKWLKATRFWGKLMLISFALGVATGIVQEFQFGMNWSNYSRFVGDIFGAPLAMEGLAAFFVESTFLGLWLFGWGRLSKKVHLATIWLVSGSTALSAYFILAANSWMQHPVGYEIVDGKAQLTSIWAVLSNNTALYAFAHTILAALLTGGMVIVGISAWHLLRNSHNNVFRASMRMVLPVLAISGVLIVVVGHFNAELMTEQQPMKMAAADAVFETTDEAGMSLFAIGSVEGNPGELQRNIEIPGALSLLATGSVNGTVEGINDLNAQYREEFGPGEYAPVVAIAYWSWRVMTGIGFIIALFALVALWYMRKGTFGEGRQGGRPSLEGLQTQELETSPRFLKVSMWMATLPFIASAAGWIFTEMGRQPWVVFGLLKTEFASSPMVSAYEVWISLIGFTLLYGVLAVIAGKIFFKVAGKGPVEESPEEDDDKLHLGLAY